MIPTFQLEQIAMHGTPEQQVSAFRAIGLSERFRERRALVRRLGPLPMPHVGHEGREIHDAQHAQAEGPVVLVEGGTTSDSIIQQIYDGLGDFYNYYLIVFDRDSFDGHGKTLIGVGHYDQDFDNAFADPSNDVIYIGDGHFFNPFATDVTVMVHEETHLVTKYTANLVEQGQSGAGNEHFSDAMAMVAEQYIYSQTVDKADWLIGRMLCVGRVARGPAHPERAAALRDALYPGDAYNDPTLGVDPQPADMAHYVKTTQDQGGVHINNGILNRAFALACIQAGGNSWLTIGPVWYGVLTGGQLSSTAQFQDIADLTYAKAAAIYGAGHPYQVAVHDGWAQVGITVSIQPAPVPVPAPGQGSPCALDFNDFLSSAVVAAHLKKAAPHIAAAMATQEGRRLAVRLRALGLVQ